MAEKKPNDAATVFVARHASTAWNTGDSDTDKLKGTEYDLPLTQAGRAEAKEMGERLEPFSIRGPFPYSDMKRSSETSEIMDQVLDLGCFPDDALHPWNVGYLSGHPRTEAAKRIRYYIENPTRKIPEGESYQDFWDRFIGALEKYMAQASRNVAEARLLVTHSCNLLAAVAYAKDGKPAVHGPDAPPPARIVKFTKTRGGRWAISTLED